MDFPLVSIIIPTFNSSGVLRGALDSIIIQEYKNYEVLIMDGGSTDDTVNIVRDYQLRTTVIRFISEKDDGIYDAMNKGASLSQGKWLYFMGSDDRLYDQHVLSGFQRISVINDCEMIYGDVFRKEDNKVYGGRFSYHRLMSENICHQAIFLKKEVFKTCGPFDTRFKALADHDLNLKLFKKGIKAKYFKILIAVFGPHGYSATYYDTAFVKRFEEIYAAYKRNICNRIRLKWDIVFGKNKSAN